MICEACQAITTKLLALPFGSKYLRVCGDCRRKGDKMARQLASNIVDKGMAETLAHFRKWHVAAGLQGDLFNGGGAAEGQRRKRAAVRQVDENADTAWKDKAYDIFVAIARRKPYLSTDEVWPVLDAITSVSTHERRAMGGVITRAKANGIIEWIDQTRASSRPVAHGSPKRLWRSLVYQPSQ